MFITIIIIIWYCLNIKIFVFLFFGFWEELNGKFLWEIKWTLYNIKITYDDSYKKYTEIPKEYTGYTVQYNNETNEQERAEIK